MDLKGSLIDTHLKIYPSENFITFLKSLHEDDNIPTNILKVIGKNVNETLKKETVQSKVGHLTDEDLKNINSITNYVKANTETKVSEPEDSNTEIPKEKQNEKEKIGDTPEKHSKDNSQNSNDSKKTKKKKSIAKEENLSDKEDDTAVLIQERVPEKDLGPHLLTSDIDWLYAYLQKRRSKGEDVPYLHTLMEGTNVEMAENKVLKRNPELEARCVKLRAQAEARAYRKMTKGVDNVRMRFPEDSIAYQMKQINRHLIAVGQFLLSIFAGFMFGFKGIEWTIGYLEFGFRLLLGVMCALVIALAEIYFLAKKLNEELSVPETTQLGGPVKFVEEHKYRHLPSEPVMKDNRKEHLD